MNGIFVRWLLLTIAIIVTSYMVGGIYVSGFFSALFAAAVLAILNALFRPILLIVTLPINIFTFGLFTFVINALLLKMASGLVPGFYVYGFWAAVFGSIIISLVNWFLTSFINERGKIGYIEMKKKDGIWQ
ncbi:MAG: phage holin family protein [Syntrophobacteraceae bacterium]